MAVPEPKKDGRARAIRVDLSKPQILPQTLQRGVQLLWMSHQVERNDTRHTTNEGANVPPDQIAPSLLIAAHRPEDTRNGLSRHPLAFGQVQILFISFLTLFETARAARLARSTSRDASVLLALDVVGARALAKALVLFTGGGM